MVYSAERIPGAEALAAQKRLAALLSYKLNHEYSEMCGFVQARDLTACFSMALTKKGARIRQRLELTDGAGMSLLVP